MSTLKRFKKISTILSIASLVASLNLMVSSTAQAAVSLTVESELQQEMKFGLDYERLWYWYGSDENKDLVAKWSVVDIDIEYIRTAINSGYELTEGNYDLTAYTKKIIPMMTSMQSADPSIKWFASPRPLNEAQAGANWQPYPTWVTGDDGNSNFNFDWEKCAQYLIRYLTLMNSYGFKISYLDITNEWQSYPTGTRVQPSDMQDIRNYLSDNLPDDIEVPLILSPSAWSFAQGAAFVSAADALGMEDGFDIASSHNTGETGTAQDFADAAAAAGKEIWDSEVHGWTGKEPAVEIPNSFEWFDRIRAGFTGLDQWLTIGTTKQQHSFILNNGTTVTRNVKYFIFKQLANTSNGGNALSINQPTEFTSTSALIKDNLLTVWILNTSETDQADVNIYLPWGIEQAKVIKKIRWNENISIEGVSDSFFSSSTDSFVTDILANSLNSFEIELEDNYDVDLESKNKIIEAEAYDTQSGIENEGNNIGYINDNDWVQYNGVNLASGNNEISIRYSAKYTDSTASLETTDGRVLGTVDLPKTNNWSTWSTITTTLSLDTVVSDLVIKFNHPTNNASTYLANLDWFSFTASSLVTLQNRNALDYAIDGDWGGDDGQNVHLWSYSNENVNQQWEEIDRGDGYYSYQKLGTTYSLDGGNNAELNQSVYLWTTETDNYNQQWKKVDMGNGYYQLQKRNALDYAIDGGSDFSNGKSVELWRSSSTSYNLHWKISYQ